MTDITPERLAEIKARTDKATAGPWQSIATKHPYKFKPSRPEFKGEGFHVERCIATTWEHPQLKGPAGVVGISYGIGIEGGPPVIMVSISEDDAAFIASARQDIPDLIASLEAAQAKLEESILTRTQDGSIAWGRIKDLERENSTFRHALQQIAQQKLASEVEDPNKADFRKWHEYSVKLARFRLEAKHGNL